MGDGFKGRGGRSVERRLLAAAGSADAASWIPDSGDRAGLGVPVSVWPLDAGSVLSRHLAEAFSRPGDLVVSTIAGEVRAVADGGRRVLVFCSARRVPVVEEAWAGVSSSVRALLRVEAVTPQNLGARLVSLAGAVDLLLVDRVQYLGEGFWSAAVNAVRVGGLLAVVCSSADPLIHGALICGAGANGWRYVQHLVATSTAELDTEANAPATRPANPGRSHRRAHRDVFLFAPTDEGASR